MQSISVMWLAMRPLRTALDQARSSRLMRVAIVLWVVWCVIALFIGAVAMVEGGEFLAAVLFVLLSIPAVGVILWFLAGSLRWIVSPKD